MASLCIILMFSMASLAPAASWPWDDGRWPWQSSPQDSDEKAWMNERPAAKVDDRNLRGTPRQEAKHQDTEESSVHTLSELKAVKTSQVDAEAENKTKSQSGIVTITLNSQLQTSAETHQHSDSNKTAPMWQDPWQNAMAEELFGDDYYENMAQAYGNSMAAMGNPLAYPGMTRSANTATAIRNVQIPVQLGQQGQTQTVAAVSMPTAQRGGVVDVKLHSELQTSAKVEKTSN